MAYFGFFKDANLTEPLMQIIHDVDATVGGTLNTSFYFGSPDEDYKAVPISPDTHITISLVDTELANGHDLNNTTGPWYVLALSEAELNTNPRNNTIQLGAEVLGGVSNAKRIWLRIYEPPGTVANYTDFEIRTNNYQVVST